MNERIKELWSEAAESTIGDSWEEQTKFLEKFAELIIEECAKLAEYQGYNRMFGNGGLRAKLHEHFGVEE